MKANAKAIMAMCLVSGVVPSSAFLAPNPTTLRTNTAVTAPPMLVAPPALARSVNKDPSARLATTALKASLFDRFFRVARGNLNAALSQFEDPEKVMDQALVDMQNDIVKIRQTYAEVTAGQRRLLSQKNQFEATANDWYQRAQLALKANKEGLAREALARREQALQKANDIQAQVDAQAANLDKLYQGMTALEGKILEAQSKKSELAARAKTAKSTVWVNDMLSGLSGKTSMDAFKRMEDKVAALEATAEVSAEMLNNALLPSSSSNSKMDVELEFRRLEASDAVDRELQKLKKQANNMLLAPAEKKETIRIPVTEKDFVLK